jgi:peptide/nickel transport system ATP-binding protein
MEPLLEVRGLTVELPTTSGWVRPVNDISFSIHQGETLGFVGESGSGKTMLALALMGLKPPGARLRGEAQLCLRETPVLVHAAVRANAVASDSSGGQSINLITATPPQIRAVRGHEIAMIFQEPMTALNPVMRIGAQIEEAICIHEPHLNSQQLRARTIAALHRATVPEPEIRVRQFPHQLSGGLRQRAMIAMALAAGPRLLIADEPTTALDVTVQKQILELLAHLRDDLGLALLFITHDLGVVAQVADRLAVMYAGRIIEEGPALEVLRHPRHPYTEGLLRAAPRLERGKLIPISGTVPPLDALPPGCAFAPRCAFRRSDCDRAVPELRAVSVGSRVACVLVGSGVEKNN